jgi:hypothetical protein
MDESKNQKNGGDDFSNMYSETGIDMRLPDEHPHDQIPQAWALHMPNGEPMSHDQTAHMAAPTNKGVDEQYELDEDLLFEGLLYEKKDRCYYQAKRKFKVFPSAYASGYIVRCRKGQIGKKNEEQELEEGTFDREKSQGLHGWFARKGGKGGKGWVDCNTCRTNPETGRKTCKSCGRQSGEKRGKYPACRPTPSACTSTGTRKKRGPTRVSWKKKKEE